MFKMITEHLLIGVAVLFLYYLYRKHDAKKLDALSFRTEDGYKINAQELITLSVDAKRSLDNSPLVKIDGGLLAFMFVPYGIVYCLSALLAKGVHYMWNIPEAITLSAYAPVVLIWLLVQHQFDKKKAKLELDELAKDIHLITPTKFSHFGKYVVNQHEFKSLSFRLKKQESNLKRIKERVEVLTLEQKSLKTKSIESKRKEKLEELLGAKIACQTEKEKIVITLKQLEYTLSDDMPEMYDSILKQKEIVSVPFDSKKVPHHIQVLMDISTNKDIPEDMRKDAEESLQLYVSKQLKDAREKTLEDVKLDLTIAKRMMEEE